MSMNKYNFKVNADKKKNESITKVQAKKFVASIPSFEQMRKQKSQ